MKRMIVLLLFANLIFLGMSGDEVASDTSRVIYIQKVFEENRKADWTIELLYAALELSRKQEIAHLEFSVLNDIYNYYKFRENSAAMLQSLKEIKASSYKYEMYDLYFRVWGDLLCRENGMGNIEMVLIQTEEMRREADVVNCPMGKLIADIVVGDNMANAHKYDEAMNSLLEALESPLITIEQKSDIYQKLSTVCFKESKNEEAIKYMDRIAAEVERENLKDKVHDKDQAVAVEIGYCKIYLGIAEAEKLKEHLEKLEALYDEDWSPRDKVNYHSYRGGYYYLIDDMANCYKEYDLAIENGKNLRMTFMISVHEMKGLSASYSNDYKTAAESYLKAVQLSYSINLDIARKNREAIQANFRIKKALLDNETNLANYNQIKVCAAILLLVVSFVVLWHVFHVYSVLRRSAEETRNAWATVDAANKMKEVFLHNFNEEIKEPIDAVIKCSTVLSSSQDISQVERRAYSENIKSHSGYLIQLVNNVLDLSRLEAGMMRFNMEKCDLVLLCQDAKRMVEIHSVNPWVHIFSTNLTTLEVYIDSTWFNRVLVYVLSAPNKYQKKCEVIYTLEVEENWARIVVELPPAKFQVQNSNDRISNEINRLYVEHFGGSYKVEENKVVITYPVNQSFH